MSNKLTSKYSPMLFILASLHTCIYSLQELAQYLRKYDGLSLHCPSCAPKKHSFGSPLSIHSDGSVDNIVKK